MGVREDGRHSQPRAEGRRPRGRREHTEVSGDALSLAPTVVGRLAKEVDLPDKRGLASSDIPESAFHARKRSGKALSPEYSGSPYRIAKAIEAAEACFESAKEAARSWITSPNVGLGGETPLAFASTPEGSDYVLKLLERLEHGAVS